MSGIINFYVFQKGQTPLILAALHGKSEIVDFLLKAGAKIDIQQKVSIVQLAFD